MAKRYVVTSSGGFSLGRGKTFVANWKQPDGTLGYTEQEVSRLTKQQIRNHFRVIEVSGASVVEAATAAPGEKRELSRTCDECGFSAKSNAGLAVHQRSHEG